ncbi:phage portal protein [Peribacillus asahii]|uniref:phage portal protein n=1 Tax=Peribacillus asahii TaxID=228899 RepID=UPI00207A4BDB|nr:phage portal protein [Peribacillus asahii]USK86172.1 phage portal protein [Peribacillus asahii]
MSTLEQYIKEKYDSSNEWFIEELQSVYNQQRIQNVLNIKDYLEGEHAIKKKEPYNFAGKTYQSRKIVLNTAHNIISFMTSFLLGNKTTITGDEAITKELSRVYRKGKYDSLNYTILERILKFGEVYEYIFIDSKGNIRSKLIDSASGTPIYNENNELICFIESYNFDGIDYYILYEEKSVTKYDNKGGDLRQTERFANLSGLPIIYRNPSEYSDVEGVSELKRWANILDNQEDLISKAVDGYYKHITGIPVVTGQQLKGEGIPSHIVGGGLTLDDGATFDFKSNTFDSNAFKTLYDQLENSLYTIAQIPSIAQGRTDISNVSSEAIRILYSNAIMRGQRNEMFMRAGLEQRLEVIIKLLQEYKGLSFTENQIDSVGINFSYMLPSSDKELIDNMKTLRDMGTLSIKTALEKSPVVSDVQTELERLAQENEDVGTNGNVNDNNVDESNKRGEGVTV